jgi:hypothetical protein
MEVLYSIPVFIFVVRLSGWRHVHNLLVLLSVLLLLPVWLTLLL